MTRAYQYYHFMVEKLKGTGIPVTMGAGHSPWGVACLIRGTTEMMMDIVSQPDFAKKLLRKCTDLALMWLRVQEKMIPPEYFKRILVWDDLASFVSLAQFREFILPCYEEIYAAFPQCDRWYHNDADATPILEGLAEAGIRMFHYGYETHPEYIKEKIGDRVCLMGNVPPLAVLRNATPEDVDLAVKDVIAKSGQGGGLVVAAGGFLDEGTPIENVEAMINACEKYGKRDDVHRLAADFYRKMAAEARIESAEKTEVEEKKPLGPHHKELTAVKEAIVAGGFNDIEKLVGHSLEYGVSPQLLLDEAMIPGMEVVGRRFSENKIFIPEMMMSARTMQLALGVLAPIISGGGTKKGEKVAIGTVKDDLHDIGKNIVVSMMQGGGFDVMDLGVDCPPEKFVQAVEWGARVIGMSAILTTTLINVDRDHRVARGKGSAGQCSGPGRRGGHDPGLRHAGRGRRILQGCRLRRGSGQGVCQPSGLRSY